MNSSEKRIEKIMRILSNKKERKFLVRIDEVHIHERVHSSEVEHIRGCVLVVEHSPFSEETEEFSYRYIIWVPYSLLLKIDPNLCVYLKRDGKLITSKEFESSAETSIFEIQEPIPENKYVSAKFPKGNSSGTSNLNGKELERKVFNVTEMYCLIYEFSEINSFQKNIPIQGWSSLVVILNTLEKSSVLYFHDGGLSDFLKELHGLITLSKCQNNSNLFLVNNSDMDPLKSGLKNQGLSNFLLSFGATIKKTVDKSKTTIVKNKDKLLKNLNKDKRMEGKLKQDIESRINQKKRNNLSLESEKKKNETMISVTDKDKEIKAKIKTNFEQASKITIETLIQKYFDEKVGKIKNLDELKSEVFYGGIEFTHEIEEKKTTEEEKEKTIEELVGGSKEAMKNMSARKFLWLHFLEYYDWNTSDYQYRKEFYLEKKKEYYMIKQQWLTMTDEQIKNNSDFRSRISKIEKDVIRTDRTYKDYIDLKGERIKQLKEILITYTLLNFDISYCQGMNDLLSPILTIMEDESQAFWCFANIMKKVGNSFSKSFNSMDVNLKKLLHIIKTLDYKFYSYLVEISADNLFFCFRWILVLFKREFSFLDTIKLWDSIFTHELDKHLNKKTDFKEILFVAFAILENEKSKIMGGKLIADQLFKFCIDLAHNIDYIEVLKTAEFAIMKYKSIIDKKKSEFQ